LEPHLDPVSNLLPTLANDNVSLPANWDEPNSSQTLHTFTGQQPSVTGVYDSLEPISYGTDVHINPRRGVTPTSYNYATPISATIVPNDQWPVPQYILNQSLSEASYPNGYTTASGTYVTPSGF
jgi:hypothetical protein